MNNIGNDSNNVLNIIFKGIEEVFKIIKVTLGPLGKNVLIRLPKKLLIVDDGVSVVNNIKTKDKEKSIGINICQSISNAVNDACGDGTTSSVIFFYFLMKYSLEKINNGVNPRIIVKNLKDSLEKLLKFIENYKLDIDINSLEMLLKSTTLDYDVINNVKDAYQKAGTNGLIFVRTTRTNEFIKHTKGYFIYIKNIYDKIELNQYKVILFNDYLYSINQLRDLDNSKYLIICRSVSDEINRLYSNTNIKIVVINERDVDIVFKDLEKILNINSSIIQLSYSKEINVMINNDCLFIDDIQSNELIDSIKEDLKVTNNISKINKLKERLAKMTNGIVTIYINATTEEELEHKSLIYEDALKTAYNALSYGVCLGGGYIYFLLLESLDLFSDGIVINSLKSMILTLINNTNYNVEYIYNNLNKSTWYDLINDQYLKISDLKVYDSIYNIKHIFKTTINNACLLINTAGIVYNDIIDENVIDEFL